MMGKLYINYNHTDSGRFARWTQRESYEFMSARPWQQVTDFYSKVVRGDVSIMDLFGTKALSLDDECKTPGDSAGTESVTAAGCKKKSGRWARATFKIVVSYHGALFDGWQKQPGLNTVQGVIEKSLGRFVDEKKAQLLEEKGRPLEGCAIVAGRTDKGVSAIQQVCSFYTWRKDVKPCDIEDAVNNGAPGSLRAVSVSEVSRAFHPNFSAKWRRYLYIFPLNKGEVLESCFTNGKFADTFRSDVKHVEKRDECDEHFANQNFGDLIISEGNQVENEAIPRNFSIHKVDQILQQLKGKLLSYKMFARDTKASRNEGPPTECFIYHAGATEARLPGSDDEEERKVMCVELVANRFLRKMVRVLVATAIREASAGAEDDALIKLTDATCRRATAPPSPPDGLCLVDVGYSEFDPRNSLIP